MKRLLYPEIGIPNNRECELVGWLVSSLADGLMPKSLHTARHRKLVDCLVEYRATAGITQTELAKRLGRPQSIVAAMEGGGRRIDLVELLQLADVLRFDVQELLRRVQAVAE